MQVSFVSSNPAAHTHPAVKQLEAALGVECSCWRCIETCSIHNVELLAELVASFFESNDVEKVQNKLDELCGEVESERKDLVKEIQNLRDAAKKLADFVAGKADVEVDEDEKDAQMAAAQRFVDRELEQINDAINWVDDCAKELDKALDEADDSRPKKASNSKIIKGRRR